MLFHIYPKCLLYILLFGNIIQDKNCFRTMCKSVINVSIISLALTAKSFDLFTKVWPPSTEVGLIT